MALDPQQRSRRPVTRALCAMLALGGIAAVIVAIVQAVLHGVFPSPTALIMLLTGIPGIYIFGRYAYLGHG